jgi:hypothetical protein
MHVRQRQDFYLEASFVLFNKRMTHQHRISNIINSKTLISFFFGPIIFALSTKSLILLQDYGKPPPPPPPNATTLVPPPDATAKNNSFPSLPIRTDFHEQKKR